MKYFLFLLLLSGSLGMAAKNKAGYIQFGKTTYNFGTFDKRTDDDGERLVLAYEFRLSGACLEGGLADLAYAECGCERCDSGTDSKNCRPYASLENF